MDKRDDIPRNKYVDLENDSKWVSVPVYINKIYQVQDIDSQKLITLSATDKIVWSYLRGYGFSHGWHSIYPNIDRIGYELGTPLSTVKRSIKTLKDIGLIKVHIQRLEGRKTSNRYTIHQPNTIPRKRWIDVNGGLLVGKLYSFDATVFKKKT